MSRCGCAILCFEFYFITKHVEEASKKNMKYITGYLERLLSLLFHRRWRMSSKTLTKLVFSYALRTHIRQKWSFISSQVRFILTIKPSAYNDPNGNSLARQELCTNLTNKRSMNCTSSTTMPLIFLQNVKRTHKVISAGNCFSFFCKLTRCIQTRYSLISYVGNWWLCDYKGSNMLICTC